MVMRLLATVKHFNGKMFLKKSHTTVNDDPGQGGIEATAVHSGNGTFEHTAY